MVHSYDSDGMDLHTGLYLPGLRYGKIVKPTVHSLSLSPSGTTARVTIENFWARRGRDAGETRARTFTNFDRGTVHFRHMGVQVSRICTKVYGSESFGDLQYTLNTPSNNFSN
jgi:hypothetical protein